ncbi:MAG: seg [Parcubacteria group bacterium]|nr:seg [Parcubacteria group bacterium]
MKKFVYAGAAALAFPFLALAQTVNSVQDLASFIINLINNVATPLIFAIAFIVFIWGIVRYFIFGGSDPAKQKEGRSLMIWGIVGFAVMLSVWGLVHILTGTLNINNSPQLPAPVQQVR